MRFKKNDVIVFKDNKIEIIDFLGEGGQGEVYKVNYKGTNYALKIYKEKVKSSFRYNLKSNIEKGSPSTNFLWPKEMIVFDKNEEYIGYLMDLRGPEYKSFVSYLTGKTMFKDTYTLLTWCIELCKSFKRLHELGFSYQDLNDGSFFLKPETGEILICDNDNVTADKKNLGILGKMRYMAPEVVRGENMPDIHSDRFSLAIILFMALCKGNPFEGECLKNYEYLDEKSDYEMYGTKPIFVYNKNDLSNRPIRGYHTTLIKKWPLLPLYIKEAFHRTFTSGLKDRENGRTIEIEWLMLLTKYRDELISCSCGNQYIYGFKEKKANEICPFCGKKTNQFCELIINRNRIILEPGKKIFMNHIDKYSSDYCSVVGEVIVSKNNPSIWGIKQSICDNIEIKDVSENVMIIKKYEVIPIVNNLKIKISDSVVGQIKISN